MAQREYAILADAGKIVNMNPRSLYAAYMKGRLAGFREKRRCYIYLDDLLTYKERTAAEREAVAQTNAHNLNQAHRQQKAEAVGESLCVVCGMQVGDGDWLCIPCQIHTRDEPYYILRE